MIWQILSEDYASHDSILIYNCLMLKMNEEKTIAHTEEALKLATCDGPPYYYKVAYEEAERFLENLK